MILCVFSNSVFPETSGEKNINKGTENQEIVNNKAIIGVSTRECLKLSLLSTIRFSVFPICLLYTNHQQLTVVAGPSVIAASTALSMGPLEITFLTDQKVNKATRERLACSQRLPSLLLVLQGWQRSLALLYSQQERSGLL